MNKRTIRMVLLLGAVLFSGDACIGPIYGPPRPLMAPQELDREAKNMSAPEDKALVYLYRRKYFPTDEVSLSVKLDGENAGSMIGGTYLMWLLTPGMHDLVSVGTNTSTLAIDARPGETYYIWLETKWPQFLGWDTRLGLGEVIPHCELLLVTKETGRERLMESRLLEGRDFYRSEPLEEPSQ